MPSLFKTIIMDIEILKGPEKGKVLKSQSQKVWAENIKAGKAKEVKAGTKEKEEKQAPETKEEKAQPKTKQAK